MPLDLKDITVTDFLNDTIDEKLIEREQAEQKVEEQTTEQTEQATTETQTQKEPITETTEPQEEESIITTLKSHFGYEVEGEFTEDLDGLKGFTSEIAKKMALSELESLFQAIPDVGDYMKYRMSGGDPSKFFDVNYSEPDYSTYQVTEDSTEVNKQVLSVFLRKQGFDDNEINETIKDYDETGILFKQATKVLPKLAAQQQAEKKGWEEKRLLEIKQQEEESQKEWQTIEQTINTGRLGNIAIPESDKDKFFSWMAIPVKDGKSQRQIDREQLGHENMLALEYLLYKKMDVSKLAVARNNTTEATRLKELLSKKGNISKGSSSNTKKQEINYSLSQFI